MSLPFQPGSPSEPGAYLSPHHGAYLTDRAVDPSVAFYGAHIRTVAAEDGARLLGALEPLPSPGLLIPYLNTPPYARVRLDLDGSWRVPSGVAVSIYIPPDCEREGDKPLFVVEGPIKALAMQDHGFNCVALGGVTTTLTKDHKLNDSWQGVALFHREVFVVFDAGRRVNAEVARAEARLVVALEAAGAKVRVVALPLRNRGEDQGPDDFIAVHDHDERALRALVAAASPGEPVERATGATPEQAVELLADLPFLWSVLVRGVCVETKTALELRTKGVKEATFRRALKEAKVKGAAAPGLDADATYEVRDGGLVHVTYTPKGEVVVPLTNFSAHILEEDLVDDGVERKSVFVVAGCLADGAALRTIELTPAEFATDVWASEQWGARAIVYPQLSRTGLHIRAAIQSLSHPVQRLTFTHTGFRDHGGVPIYLHANGAVGATDVSVRLEGPGARYQLPVAPVGLTDMQIAIRWSFGIADIGARRITLVLLAAAYRAPLQSTLYCDASVAVVGRTGSLKSSVVAVPQSHFGDFGHSTLPLNWSSTPNALELQLSMLRDSLVTIDDFVPKGGADDDMQRKGAQVFRSIGNGSSRGRLRRDCTSMPDRPCRALVISTGEDVPRGESIQARLIIVRMSRADVHLPNLTSLQAGQQFLPDAMRGYIEFLRANMPQIKAEAKSIFTAFRDGLQGDGGHLRAPAAMAHLLLGAYYFAQFAQAVGVIDAAQAAHYLAETRAALVENDVAQSKASLSANPAIRFVQILRDLRARKQVVLRKLGTPAGEDSSLGENGIGWKDETYAYLLPDATFAAVSEHQRAINEGAPLQQYGLWAALTEAGFIIPCGTDSTHKITIHGQRVRVVKMPLSTLSEPELPDPEPEDDGVENDGASVDTVGGVAHGASPVAPPLHVAPSTGVSSQVPSWSPELFGRSGQTRGGPDRQGTSILADLEEQFHPPSAQVPRSFRQGVLCGDDILSPGVRANECPTGALMLAGDTWAHGQLNQSSLITTILAAGEVGLALGELGGSPVVALAVPGAGVHLLATNTLDSVKGALERVLVVGHGLKRLLALLNQNGVFPTQLFDTQIAWQLLDGHRHDDERFFSLENARPGAGIAALPADTPHRERLCADAEHVLGLKQALRSELSQHGLEHVAALEFALLPVVVEIEATGVAVDAVAWAGVRDEYNREARALAGKLKASLGVRNVDDDLQVLAGLQCLGLPVTQTSRIALAQYSDRPVVEQLARYRRLIGFVRSSGKAVLEAVAESADGRVHTNIHQLGAKTGRMSCSAPNLMGLPRDVEIRACIVAPYGKKLIVGDYKAIEMRVIADQTGDAALREVFLRGGCPHKHTASILTGTPEASATDEQKNHAKPLNFGLCFGMSSPTLVPYARKNFRVVMTEAEAEQFKNKFFDHYSGVREWHARTRAQAPMQLRTRSGRVTYYLRTDEGFNARLSYPVQGTAADGMKAAIVLLHPRLARFGARIVLVVHDEVVVEVPDEHAEEVRLLVRECMIAGMQPYVPSVPIIVEPEVRRSWAV